MKITTDGGTTFVVDRGQVTITRTDQPECTVPLADLKEFVGLYDLEDDDDDFEGGRALKAVSIGTLQERRDMADMLRRLADALNASEEIPVDWQSVRDTASAITHFIEGLQP